MDLGSWFLATPPSVIYSTPLPIQIEDGIELQSEITDDSTVLESSTPAESSATEYSATTQDRSIHSFPNTPERPQQNIDLLDESPEVEETPATHTATSAAAGGLISESGGLTSADNDKEHLVSIIGMLCLILGNICLTEEPEDIRSPSSTNPEITNMCLEIRKLSMTGEILPRNGELILDLSPDLSCAKSNVDNISSDGSVFGEHQETDPQAEAQYAGALGAIYEERRIFRQAISKYKDTLSIFETLNLQELPEYACLTLSLADMYGKDGLNSLKAIDAYRQAYECFQRIKDTQNMIRARAGLVEVFRENWRLNMRLNTCGGGSICHDIQLIDNYLFLAELYYLDSNYSEFLRCLIFGLSGCFYEGELKCSWGYTTITARLRYWIGNGELGRNVQTHENPLASAIENLPYDFYTSLQVARQDSNLGPRYIPLDHDGRTTYRVSILARALSKLQLDQMPEGGFAIAEVLFSALMPNIDAVKPRTYYVTTAWKLFQQSLHYLDHGKWENALHSLRKLNRYGIHPSDLSAVGKRDWLRCKEELQGYCQGLEDDLSVGVFTAISQLQATMRSTLEVLDSQMSILQASQISAQLIFSNIERLSQTNRSQRTRSNISFASNAPSNTSCSTSSSSRFGITYSVGTASTGCSLVSNSRYMVP